MPILFSHYKRAALPVTALLAAVLLAGCPSFDTSVKPLLGGRDSTGADTSQVYMTGHTTIDQVDPSGLTLDIWRIVTDQFPDSVRVFARVYSKADGMLVGGLAPPYYNGAEDYHTVWNGLSEQVKEDGRVTPVPDYTVREFSDQDGVPFQIALSLDYSGSMGSNIKPLEDAAAGFVRMKRPQDRIALVKFSDKARLISPLTDAQDSLTAKFGRGLDGFGSYTALYAAMKLGADQLAGAPADYPRALVLFTDGEDNASQINSGELYQFCRKNSIPVFAIAFGAVNRQALEAIATNTGGRYYQTKSPDEFAKVFKDIYLSLRNYYMITYKPLPYGGTHIVQVTLNPKGSHRQPTATGTYTVEGPPPQRPSVIDSLPSLYFDYNTPNVRPDSRMIVDSVIFAMKKNPRLLIEVWGHASSEGTEEHNMALSQQRADTVRALILSAGVQPERVNTRAFGALQPIANNATEEGRSKNRRASFVILRR